MKTNRQPLPRTGDEQNDNAGAERDSATNEHLVQVDKLHNSEADNGRSDDGSAPGEQDIKNTDNTGYEGPRTPQTTGKRARCMRREFLTEKNAELGAYPLELC